MRPDITGTGPRPYVYGSSYTEYVMNVAYLFAKDAQAIPPASMLDSTQANHNVAISLSNIQSPATAAFVMDGITIFGHPYSIFAPTENDTLTVGTVASLATTNWEDQQQYSVVTDATSSDFGLGAAIARHTGFVNVLWADGHVKPTGLNTLARMATTPGGKTVGASFVGNGY